MRNFIFAISLSAILLMVACSGSDSQKLPMSQATAQRQVPLQATGSSPRCEVTLQVSFLSGQDQVAKAINSTVIDRLFFFQGLTMQQAVDSFANAYCRSYVDNLRPLFRDDQATTARHAWYEYRYKLTTETRQERQGRLTYLVHLDYYEGGAHGISQLMAMNFDTASGSLLTLDDILAEGYEQSLNELLLKALMEKTGAKSEEQLHEQGYLNATTIFAPENFILGSDDITFIYNAYEIAPYDKGQTQLSIDLGQLKQLLKDDGNH